MTQPQPGWYPDPADPDRQRYWAGDAWTAETRTSETAMPVDPFAAYAGRTVSPVQPAYTSPYPQSGQAVAMPGAVPTTADGVPLAGWWWRVLAAILDSLIISAVSMAFMPIYWTKMVNGFTAFFNDVTNAVNNNSATLPNPYDPTYGFISVTITRSIIALIITCVYVFFMLTFNSATLGQMACGLRVVPVDKGKAPRRLPIYSVVMRILFYTAIVSAISIVNLIITVNNPASISLNNPTAAGYGGLSALTTLAGIYQIMNVLWAAWDRKRQCLHDKIAHTQVVRTR